MSEDEKEENWMNKTCQEDEQEEQWVTKHVRKMKKKRIEKKKNI